MKEPSYNVLHHRAAGVDHSINKTLATAAPVNAVVSPGESVIDFWLNRQKATQVTAYP